MTGRIRNAYSAELSPRRHSGSKISLSALLGGVLALLLLVPAAAQAQRTTLFDNAQAPIGDAVQDSPLEVGVRLKSDVDGFITALRFYRQASNIGPREGHLWSSTGTLLATVQFPASATGWQEADLSSPVAITAGAVYTASYYASTGRFAFDLGAFNSGPLDRAPLHAPAMSDGGNGVYRYGATGGFPTDSWNGTNYWVDAVFHPSIPADTKAPTVESTSPASTETGVPADATVKVTFNEPMDALTVNNGSIALADGPNAIAANVTYDAGTRTATLTPTAPLQYGKTYTATVKSGNAGPADAAGNRFAAAHTWNFTTAPQCPCTILGDTGPTGNAVQDQPLELGIKFRPTEDGFITGLRFYKQINNSGTHVGHLWTASGQLLATAPFQNETAEGWQQADLTNPVAVTKNTTYVVSYYSPNGYYAYEPGRLNSSINNAPMFAPDNASAGGNGVYKYGASAFPTESWNATNYWVDASFDRTIPPDTEGPTVVSTDPASGGSDVARTAALEAEFDEPLNAATVTASTFQLRDSANALVPGTVTYDAQTRTAKLQPGSPLAFDATYTATLKSGAAGVKDVSNNPLAADKTWSFTIAGKTPAEGPGGPILLINSPADPFGTYYAEILRSEGLNAFATAQGTITAQMLTGKTLVILASPTVTAAEVTVLSNWVNAGGNLIAMRPDKKLAPLLGLTDASATLPNAYMKVDTGTAEGEGIEAQTMQFHGTADRYALNGASAIASLYSNATTALTNPAVTTRAVGSAGGQAAAFTYDLARSIVYTRQGNPAWVDDKRDGTGGWIPGTRPIDLFYGPKVGDMQPNWVDMDKIDVPQADEQQRLLANMITEMNLDKAPMPRFWYLPRGEKAAVIMTGDDHGYGAMVPYLNRMKSMSPAGCSVAEWECIRSSMYVYNGTPVTDAQMKAFQDDGFELGLHLNTSCDSYTPQLYDQLLSSQLATFKSTWPSISDPQSSRTHCVIWSGWATQPKGERAKGIRFDTNYYYQGPAGYLKKPGLLIGSGFPQRFADLDGSLIDVYQSMTYVTDESPIDNAVQLHTLLDGALGAKGYYGAFNVLAHGDYGDHNNANTMVSEAQRRGVPVISSKQALDWTDGRNGSAFADIAYSGGQLTFAVAPSPKANGLEAMLPANSATGPLSKLRRDGAAVAWDRRTVKGVDYVVFKAAAGNYTATYATDATAPEISGINVQADNEGRATVTWTTDEPASSKLEYGRTATLGYEINDTARVNDHKIELTGLAAGTTYQIRVSSTDAAGNTGASATQAMNLPAGVVADTYTNEFAAGTPGGSTWVGATMNGTDGEVTLAPVAMGSSEFDGSALPADWSAKPWYTGGFTTVSDGTLLADSSVAMTNTLFGSGRSLEFSATFQPVNDQGVGFSNDFGDYPFAAFSTGSNGSAIKLYALTGANASQAGHEEFPIDGVDLSVPHRFRIVWNTASVEYYVDGQHKRTAPIAVAAQMRPMASDFRLFGAGVQVHWMRLGNYPTAGNFISRVHDGGPGASVWQNLTATTDLQPSTGVTFQTRTGATPTPDASWSAWANVGAGGAVTSPAARYIQYTARLTRTTQTNTPTLKRVQITRVAGTDRAPTLGTVSISPAAPRTNQVVTATPAGFSDPDGDPITYRYQWLKNGTPIVGATTNTLNLGLAGNGDLGDKVRVEVYATDGRGAASDAAIATSTVTNTTPTAGTAAVRPAPPSTNDVVTAVPSGFADLDGEELTYRYQWRRNNAPIAGATSRTLDLSLANNGNQGDRIDVDITAVDGAGAISPAARGGQNITATNSTPVAGTVAIAPPSPKTNQALTATPTGFRDPDNNPITYSYQWKRNGTNIAGATTNTLNLATAGNGDRGDTITVNVTAKDNLNAVSDVATGTATVANSAPVAGTVKVKPAGPATDDVVTAQPADFVDDDGDAITYEYQWLNNGQPISGQRGRTMDLSEPGNGDLGDSVSVEIRALDGNGGTSSTVSGSTTVASENTSAVAAFGFEEAAGNVSVDDAGGNDGTLAGPTRVNTGKFGRALYFDGKDDVVNVPDAPTLRLSTGMTLEAWVKPDAATNWRTILFKEAMGVGYSLYSNANTDNASAHIGTSAGELMVDGTESLDPNGWTHLAATFDGHILRLFANGEQIGSKATNEEMLHGEGPLTFGGNAIWGEHFKGSIDEIRIYDRPLSASDIRDDMTRPVITGTPVPPDSLAPAQVGEFAKPMSWPIVPVHLALLSNGKVAAWDGFEAALNSEHTWDPWTQQFDSVPSGRNLFCAGHITLTDGRLLVVGGHVNAYEGLKDTNLFNPAAKTWTRGADMAEARWYPTATTLPDGRVLVVSGDNPVLDRPGQPVPLTIASNTLPEIYNPANDTWQQLPQAQRWMPLYPFMFVLPNGKVFDAGPDKTTRTLDVATGQWTTVGTSPIDGHSAVQYLPGKILKSGTWSEPEFPGGTVTNGAAAIDFTQPTPSWQSVAPMKYARSYHTLTVLPDGKVLASGGQNGTDGVDQTTGILATEIWDPATNTWTVGASSRRPRLYHSSSLLLPDGRVLLAGGGAFGNAPNEKSGEIYSPPYLFKGPRPSVTAAPDRVNYNAQFNVDTPDASRISKVNLVHMGAVTHNLDMDQRLVPLNFTQQGDGIRITGPANANVAPPGWYMVFLVDNNGVPSYGQTVRVDAAGDTQAPTAPATLTATPRTDGATLNWGASTDNVGVAEYRVYRSTTSGFTPAAANRIARVESGTTYTVTGAAAATYYYKVQAVDAAGNRSPASPQAQSVVTGDATAPTVSITSPANAASLAGTVQVNTTANDAVGVASVQLKLDGADLGEADTTAPFQYSWDTTKSVDGRHTLTAIARDATGNSTTSAVINVTVRNTGVVAAYGFDEASGTAATDAIGALNGTISGAARVPAGGRFGSALSFDGVNDAVNIANSSALDLASGMTLEAWVKPTALGGFRSVIFKERTGSLAYALFASDTGGFPAGDVFANAEVAAPATAGLPLGIWAHLTMTWNGTTVKTYVDAAEVGTMPAPGPLVTSTGQLRIGGDSIRNGWFNGLIDEVRIYNRPLTAAEIQVDMNRAVKP